MSNIYILRLVDGSYYVGSTSDLDSRIERHKSGKVTSNKDKLPLELIYSEEFISRGEAQAREYQIKDWKSRKAIERLINKIDKK